MSAFPVDVIDSEALRVIGASTTTAKKSPQALVALGVKYSS
jgi:hypothetical protein